MLLIAALVAVGTLGELALVGHTADPVQRVPFVLIGLGLAAVAAALLLPGPRTILGLRTAAAILLLGSGFGIWEHLEHNYLFEAEIRPGAPAGTLLWEAVSGASPLLAPGAVGVIGLLAGAATIGAAPRGG